MKKTFKGITVLFLSFLIALNISIIPNSDDGDPDFPETIEISIDNNITLS